MAKTRCNISLCYYWNFVKNPSSAGFRTFQIDANNTESSYLQPISIDDLKALKPFPDAANHTCIAIFKKSKNQPIYPITYNLWEAKTGAKELFLHISHLTKC